MLLGQNWWHVSRPGTGHFVNCGPVQQSLDNHMILCSFNHQLLWQGDCLAAAGVRKTPSKFIDVQSCLAPSIWISRQSTCKHFAVRPCTSVYVSPSELQLRPSTSQFLYPSIMVLQLQRLPRDKANTSPRLCTESEKYENPIFHSKWRVCIEYREFA